ncbi:MAG TPA: OadG family protein [Clostridia bacterium]|nr:OadG family protein [Clostridia bacterium]
MTQVGDAIATVFTFLVFLMFIIFPMAMAFAQAKKDRRAPSSPKEGEKTGKAASGKKGSRGLFSQLERLRADDRESDPEVSFSEGRTTEEVKAYTQTHKPKRTTEQHTTQQLGEKFNPIEGMKNTGGAALSQRTDIAPTAARTKRAALPNSPAISKLQELNELQRAIVLSEVLGPPKGIQRD